MKYNTPQERKNIYLLIQKELIKQHSTYSLCWALSIVLKITDLYEASNILEEHLPEMIKQKPKKVNLKTMDGLEWWWDIGNLGRRNIACNDAIMLCDKQIN